MNYQGQQTMHEREALSQTQYRPVSGLMAGSVETVPARALPVTRNRIGQLVERVAEIAERLEGIGDLVFGSPSRRQGKRRPQMPACWSAW